MISVLIPTLNSERQLVPTLSALVPGSAEGLVREVILADGGSTDGTAKIADAAGCEFRPGAADEDGRLKAAAATARGDWLLIIGPASALQEGWTREAAKFVESAERAKEGETSAAVFRMTLDGYGFSPRVRELAAMAHLALTGRPRFEHGLLISKRLFASRGRRAGRVVRLRTRVVIPG